MNNNDIDATLNHLNVPVDERVNAKKELEILYNHSFTAVKGGETKLKILKKWGVPYAAKLYINHEMIEDAKDVGSLAAAIAAACGPEAAPIGSGAFIPMPQ